MSSHIPQALRFLYVGTSTGTTITHQAVRTTSHKTHRRSHGRLVGTCKNFIELTYCKANASLRRPKASERTLSHTTLVRKGRYGPQDCQYGAVADDRDTTYGRITTSSLRCQQRRSGTWTTAFDVCLTRPRRTRTVHRGNICHESHERMSVWTSCSCV